MKQSSIDIHLITGVTTSTASTGTNGNIKSSEGLLKMNGTETNDVANGAVTASALTGSNVNTNSAAGELEMNGTKINEVAINAARLNGNLDVAETKESSAVLFLLLGVLYSTFFGSEGTLIPFLPVYYHSLGHDGLIIGVLGSVTPFTTFCVGPLWGMVSDREGQTIAFLFGTMLMAMIGQLLVLLFDDPVQILLMMCLKSVFVAPVKPMIDSVVMENLTRYGQSHNFGKFRLWAVVSLGVAMAVAGQLVQEEPQVDKTTGVYDDNTEPSWHAKFAWMWEKVTGYRVLFVVYGLLHIPTFLCLLALQKMSPSSSDNIMKRDEDETSGKKENTVTSNSGSLIKLWGQIVNDPASVSFFLLVFLMGATAAVGENFAYVRMREVGGTARDMGLSRLACSLVSAPAFYFSGRLLQFMKVQSSGVRLSLVDKVMILCFLCQAARFAIFATMTTPRWGHLAEALRGFSFAAFWTTSTLHASNIAPPRGRTTMVGRILAQGGHFWTIVFS